MCVGDLNACAAKMPRAPLQAPAVWRTAARSLKSQSSRHFRRLVGITPGQFRTPASFA
jgi:hypothetical protein